MENQFVINIKNSRQFHHEFLPQVNHLSPFLLTLELLPIILTTASACGDCRIVFVASSGHSMYDWNPANMNAELSQDRLKFYPYSKLYNVSFCHD